MFCNKYLIFPEGGVWNVLDFSKENESVSLLNGILEDLGGGGGDYMITYTMGSGVYLPIEKHISFP